MFPVINPWMFMNPVMTQLLPLGAPQMPLSGDVVQDINPITSWLSPNLQFNFAGNPTVEKDIHVNVASYGRQLGTLIPAVLALAADNDSPEVEKLRSLAADIEAVKAKHRQDKAQLLKQDLLLLKKEDPEGFRVLLEALTD